MQHVQTFHAASFPAPSGLAMFPTVAISSAMNECLLGSVTPPNQSQYQYSNTGVQNQPFQVQQVLAPHMQTYHGTVAQPSQTGVFAPSCGPQLMQSVAGLQLSREHRTIFFAGCTPIVSSETIYALFSQFGRVEDINLFRPYSGSKTSKGCGLVVFGDRAAAGAALEALNGKFQWPGARGPMIVEWMDPNKQHKKARAQPLSLPSLQQSHVAMAMQPGLACLLPNHLTNQLYTNTAQLFC